MPTILVAGLINIETTLKIDGFPLVYQPVRYPFFGVNSTVSGVGFNIAKALTTLGNDVDFLSLIGRDTAAELIRNELRAIRVSDENVISQLENTPQSVILYEETGRRAIFTDLKDIQEQIYPPEIAESALKNASLAVLANINFSRPLLAKARALNIPIATDVHAIGNPDDEYNRDYMGHADILFQSHERLPCSPEDWAREMQHRYSTPIVVIGMGEAGALLAVQADHRMERIPAVVTRPVANTIGAGDALCSAFIHAYVATHDPYLAIRKAIVFASYKIGAAGGADGFLDAAGLEVWYQKHF